MADGTRTRDHRDHNPGLYQLSYRHQANGMVSGLDGRLGLLFVRAPESVMRPEGFEPPTNGLEGRRSSTELRAPRGKE